MADFKQNNLSAPKEEYMTEIEVRELIAASLANWTGVTRFRTIETNIVTITDFTDAQHNHTGTSNGGQITDAALSSVVTVPKGGTGVNTIASGSFLKGNGAGAITTQAAGLSATYTFGGGGSGDIASMTFTSGLLTAITTVP